MNQPMTHHLTLATLMILLGVLAIIPAAITENPAITVFAGVLIIMGGGLAITDRFTR